MISTIPERYFFMLKFFLWHCTTTLVFSSEPFLGYILVFLYKKEHHNIRRRIIKLRMAYHSVRGRKCVVSCLSATDCNSLADWALCCSIPTTASDWLIIFASHNFNQVDWLISIYFSIIMFLMQQYLVGEEMRNMWVGFQIMADRKHTRQSPVVQ